MSMTATPNNIATVEGDLAAILFSCQESAFSILRLATKDGPVEITGILDKPVIIGEHLKAQGVREQSPNTAGFEIAFTSLLSRPPKSLESLIPYIAGICGISRGVANDLVGAFGEDVVAVLDRDGTRLIEVLDDSEMVGAIMLRWRQKRGLAQAEVVVEDHGIPFQAVQGMLNRYGDDLALETVLREDPFLLYRASESLIFKQVCTIAKKYKIDLAGDSALRGAIIALLRSMRVTQAKTFVAIDAIDAGLQRFFSRKPIGRVRINQAIDALRGELYVDSAIIQLADDRRNERRLAQLICRQHERPLEWEYSPSVPRAAKMFPDLTINVSLEDLVSHLDLPLSTFISQKWQSTCELVNVIDAFCSAFRVNYRVVTVGDRAATRIKHVAPNADAVSDWGAAIGLKAVGPPEFRDNNTWQESLIVVICADRLGVTDYNHLLNALNHDCRLVLIGSGSSCANAEPGNPFIALSEILRPLSLDQIDVEEALTKLDFTPSSALTHLSYNGADRDTLIGAIYADLLPALQIEQSQVRVITSKQRDPTLRDAVLKVCALTPDQIHNGVPFATGEPVVMLEAISDKAKGRFTQYSLIQSSDVQVQLASSSILINAPIDKPITLFQLLGGSVRFATRDLATFTLVDVPAGSQISVEAVHLLMSLTEQTVLILHADETLKLDREPFPPSSLLAQALVNEMAKSA